MVGPKKEEKLFWLIFGTIHSCSRVHFFFRVHISSPFKPMRFDSLYAFITLLQRVFRRTTRRNKIKVNCRLLQLTDNACLNLNQIRVDITS